MSKYIIEIEDEPIGGLYKAKEFNSLVFDQTGLDRLKKIDDVKCNEEVNKEPNLDDYIWRPQKGEEFWFIHNDVSIGHGRDALRRFVGNTFRTEVEARSALLASRTYLRLLRYSKASDEAHPGMGCPWCIGQDLFGEFTPMYVNEETPTTIHFATQEDAQQVIDAIGQETLHKCTSLV